MIKILVDSTADCPRKDPVFDLFVPLTVSVGAQDYRDGIDLDADRFYELLTTAQEFPKTSQPSPDAFAALFEQAKQNGDEILCFCVSSALSGTYQSACIAKQMVDFEGIYVLDTLLVSHLIGVLAEYAAKRIREGADAQCIFHECEALKHRIKVFAGLDTLEYLYKGGRLSRAGAAVGQIAGIKPIITLTEDGKVNAGIKAIGIPRAIQTILAKIGEYDLDNRFPVYTLYTKGTENTEKLEAKLAAAGIPVTDRRQVGPTIGAHVGPGVYGILFVTK